MAELSDLSSQAPVSAQCCHSPPAPPMLWAALAPQKHQTLHCTHPMPGCDLSCLSHPQVEGDSDEQSRQHAPAWLGTAAGSVLAGLGTRHALACDRDAADGALPPVSGRLMARCCRLCGAAAPAPRLCSHGTASASRALHLCSPGIAFLHRPGCRLCDRDASGQQGWYQHRAFALVSGVAGRHIGTVTEQGCRVEEPRSFPPSPQHQSHVG